MKAPNRHIKYKNYGFAPRIKSGASWRGFIEGLDLMEHEKTLSAGIVISPTERAIKLAVIGRQGEALTLVGSEDLPLADGIRKATERVRQIAGVEVPVVVGVDSAQVRFVDVSLPPVDESQMESLLKVQVETKLPMPVEQMSLAWSQKPGAEGIDCTVAATKAEWVNASMVLPAELTHCTIAAQGLVEIWKRASVGQSRCVLLEQQESRFLMALVCDGRMQSSLVIDAEMGDDTDQVLGELVVQDILQALDGLSIEQGRPSVVILSESAAQSQALKIRLEECGWDAELCSPDEILSQVLAGGEPAVSDLKATGLALLGFSPEQIEYDFSKAIKAETQRRQVQAGALNLRNAIAITLGLVVLSMAFSYWAMKKDVSRMQAVLTEKTDELSAEQILKEQQFRESIARARPDMQDLWEKIQLSQEGVLLDSFEFEKGKPIKITAKGGKYDSVYKFQKTLESQSGISEVKLIEPRYNEKEKKTYFTMTFKYKHFSK
ncbi:MAG: type IV pilus biogenesis protein PilM [Planctomycetota bacterium]|jgi:hypothetical protein